MTQGKFGSTRSSGNNVHTPSKSAKPFILNKILENSYLADRAKAAAAKREAAAKAKQEKEKLLKDIAHDSRHGLSQQELRTKYRLSRPKLADYLADILMHRY